MGRTRLAAHLAPSLHLVMGLAEHAASVRRQRGGSLSGIMVPQFLGGFEPGAAFPARRSFVDSGRCLATCYRPSSPWRHGVHVGHALRPLVAAPFVFPHRFANRAALGLAHPGLRSPRLAFANRNYWRLAGHFAVSASCAQHELCVSGSLASPLVGTGSRTSARDSRREHSVFLLADASCVLAGFPAGSKTRIKVHQGKGLHW